jgi:hypothetical protein
MNARTMTTTAALALAALTQAPSAGAVAAKGCPKPSTADVLCRVRGDVSHAAQGDSTFTSVRANGSKVHYHSWVHVGSGASGTMLFARQASCDLGGTASSTPTDLVTRFGDDSPQTGAHPLFFQRRGRASCRFARRVTSSTLYFCQTDHCPLTVYADGTRLPTVASKAVADVAAPEVDARMAQAATTTTTHNEVDLDFCTGSYRIDYVDNTGLHHRSVEPGDGLDHHVHMHVEETHTETMSNGPGFSSSGSTDAFTFETDDVGGDGACDAFD